jgi:hypothetical protein
MERLTVSSKVHYFQRCNVTNSGICVQTFIRNICYILTYYNVCNQTQPNLEHTHTHISDKRHCAKFIFNPPLVQTTFVIYNL